MNDQLLEVDGKGVADMCLKEVLPLLQKPSNDVIRLKLARLISIPERDFSGTLRRSNKLISEGISFDDSRGLAGFDPKFIPHSKPPLPSPSPCRSVASSISIGNKSFPSSYTNYE